MSEKNSSKEELPPWIRSRRGPPGGPRRRPPGSPEQGPPGGAGRPPWMNSLDLAKSTDGLHFEKLERTVVAHGGVPSLMYDHGKNRIVAIYQYFSFEKEEDFDKIGVSVDRLNNGWGVANP